jgi:hypothetical protein
MTMSKKKKDTFFEPEVQSMHSANGKMYVCSCGCGAVAVDKWDDDDEWNDTEITLSLWQAGKSEYSLRWKLRHIWHIIRYGHPYADEVHLTLKQAQKMGKLLLKLSKPKKPKES